MKNVYLEVYANNTVAANRPAATTISDNTSFKVNSNTIKTINSFNIRSSFKNFTDTCNITIPTKSAYIVEKTNQLVIISNDTNVEDQVYKRGDRVLIRTTYSPTNDRKYQFVGFIVGFKLDNNLIHIECNDSMYLFKATPKIRLNYKEVTLKKLLEDLSLEVNAYATTKGLGNVFELSTITPDINLGNLTINFPMSPAEILNLVKEKYGLITFFRNEYLLVNSIYETIPKLYSGFEYPIDNETEYSKTILLSDPYDTARNPIIESSLDKIVFDIDELIVRGLSTGINNEKYEVVCIYKPNQTDPEVVVGADITLREEEFKLKTEQINIKIPNITLDDLKQLCINRFMKHPKGGYSGTLRMFGEPIVRHGDVVDLVINTSLLEKTPTFIKESYFISEVETIFNESEGFKQVLTLDVKVN